MFISTEAKIISDAYRTNSLPIRNELKIIFDSSIVGTRNEIVFIDNLVKEIKNKTLVLSPNGYSVNVNSAVIHQKPIVNFVANGKITRCELGDMLVTIKYHLPCGKIEAKSIIYQIKLSQDNSDKCIINNNQLALLSDWDGFEFGRKSEGGPQTYNIFPNTLEFGSYMLELRSPKKGAYIANRKSYGVCSYAMQVRTHGPKEILLNKRMYCRSDYNNFFSHMAFEIGESHENHSVRNLIESLYRYVGLAPDPPYEFSGYWDKIDGDGFGVLELNVINRIQD